MILNELGDQEHWLKKSVECLEKIKKKEKPLTPKILSQKLYQQGFTWETIEKAVEIFNGMENVPNK